METENLKKNKNRFRKVAFGVGTAIVLGTASSFKPIRNISVDAQLTEGEVSFAGSMDGNMTFEDAFDAARENVGPRGAFEWQGSIFSTYTEQEWDSLSDSEKADYLEQLDWDVESIIEDRIESELESEIDAVLIEDEIEAQLDDEIDSVLVEDEIEAQLDAEIDSVLIEDEIEAQLDAEIDSVLVEDEIEAQLDVEIDAELIDEEMDAQFAEDEEIEPEVEEEDDEEDDEDLSEDDVLFENSEDLDIPDYVNDASDEISMF